MVTDNLLFLIHLIFAHIIIVHAQMLQFIDRKGMPFLHSDHSPVKLSLISMMCNFHKPVIGEDSILLSQFTNRSESVRNKIMSRDFMKFEIIVLAQMWSILFNSGGLLLIFLFRFLLYELNIK